MVPPIRPSSHPSHVMRGIALRVAAGLSFGMMVALIKLGSNLGAGLAELIFYRSSFGLIVVLLWVLPRDGLAGLKARRPILLLRRNAIGMLGMFAAFGSVILLPLAEATSVGFTGPIFATLLSWLVLHERVGRHRWFAALICFAGVLVVMRPGTGGEAIAPIGVAVGLVAALCAATVTVAVRDMAGSESVGAIVAWFMAGSMLVGALMMAVMGASLGWHVVLLLAVAGVFGGFGQLWMTASLHSAPVAVLVPFDYMQLIWAVLLGWLVIGSEPTLYTWTGAALIAGSGLYTVLREQRRNRPGEVPAPATQPLV